MKRSFIDQQIKETYAFFERHHFHLPVWSRWTPQDWKQAQDQTKEIRKNGLGWDLTDFGYGDFGSKGLTLFTLRNGLAYPGMKPYCEKIMHVRTGQLTPFHYHADKIEDIIFRAGSGRFCLTLLPTDPDLKPVHTGQVNVEIDGIMQEVKAGETVVLTSGQSITLHPYLYHQFWAEDGDCMIGEVSTINDDAKDNYFLENSGRFASIEEDVPGTFLLCNEYS